MVKMWFKKEKKKKDFQEIKLRCPRDNRIMKKIRKNDVIIDVCPKCNGIWLDDNEINKLVEISKKGDEK